MKDANFNFQSGGGASYLVILQTICRTRYVLTFVISKMNFLFVDEHFRKQKGLVSDEKLNLSGGHMAATLMTLK